MSWDPGEWKMGTKKSEVIAPAPDPRDRELEILRAQVRVLINRFLCGSNLQRDVEMWSRRQAEKEVLP